MVLVDPRYEEEFLTDVQYDNRNVEANWCSCERRFNQQV